MSAYSQLDNASKQELLSNLELAIQDANGSAVYSKDKALVGYIEANKFMVVPKSFYESAKNDAWNPTDLDVLGGKDGLNQFLESVDDNYLKANEYLRSGVGFNDVDSKNLMFHKIAAMNFIYLKGSGEELHDRFAISILRARYCMIGALHISSKDGLTKYEEVIDVDANTSKVSDQVKNIAEASTLEEIFDEMADDFLEYNEAMKDPESGIKWLVNKADNIWAAVEYVFRVRSHHFKTTGSEKDSYTDIYTRFLKACYEGEFNWPNNLKMFSIFHTCVHPFKMKALPIITAHMAAHGVVAQAAILRFEGSPCGRSRITTTSAALNTLRGEIWYRSFYKVYSVEYDLLVAVTDIINSDKYAFHLGAGLYGKKVRNVVTHGGRNYTLTEVESITTSLAAAAQGLIQALSTIKSNGMISDFSLSNAKALSKAGASSPLLLLRITSLIIKSMEEIADAKNMTDAIESALPALSSISNP